MQSVQRQFGKLWNKSPGDNAKVSVLLKDYEDADKALAKIIDGNRSWRESWVALVNSQLQAIVEYEGLYDPIVGASDGHGTEGIPTPALQLNRTFRLREAYAELKAELLEEIGQIDDRIIKPATDARDYIQPIRKTIKKRENKRVDYEKCQAKFSKLHQKPSRSPKEEASLAKTEDEMAHLADEFSVADAHLRETLPPIIAASFSLIQPLLSAHVLIQNRLLGLYYTTLNAYCEELGFPSPPPPMEEVTAEWNAKFMPAQRDIESLNSIARGKAARQPMNVGSDPQSRKPALSPMALRDGFRRSSSGLIPNANNSAAQRPLRNPPPPSPAASEQPPQRGRDYQRPDYLTPTDFTTATVLGRSPGVSPNSPRPRPDYFNNNNGGDSRGPSPSGRIRSSVSQQALRDGIAKKKPPPPPVKRIAARPAEEFVVAQYDFAGQGQGDLTFREGDRIKIVKKTTTDQDWWVGELAGVRGNFPANYCKPA